MTKLNFKYTGSHCSWCGAMLYGNGKLITLTFDHGSFCQETNCFKKFTQHHKWINDNCDKCKFCEQYHVCKHPDFKKSSHGIAQLYINQNILTCPYLENLK